jgi:hypothetical protein
MGEAPALLLLPVELSEQIGGGRSAAAGRPLIYFGAWPRYIRHDDLIFSVELYSCPCYPPARPRGPSLGTQRRLGLVPEVPFSFVGDALGFSVAHHATSRTAVFRRAQDCRMRSLVNSRTAAGITGKLIGCSSSRRPSLFIVSSPLRIRG